jgi:hypothetical protein
MWKGHSYDSIMGIPVGRRGRICEELTRLDERVAKKTRGR